MNELWWQAGITPFIFTQLHFKGDLRKSTQQLKKVQSNFYTIRTLLSSRIVNIHSPSSNLVEKLPIKHTMYDFFNLSCFSVTV